MIVAQLGREEVAELSSKKRARNDGKKKKTNFGRDFEKYRSFYFMRFGNLEDAFRSLAICNKSNVLLVLLSALSFVCVMQTKEFF